MTTTRRTLLAATGLAVAAGAGGGWLTRQTDPATSPSSTSSAPALATATVVRTDLRTMRQYYGTIGFGPTTEMVSTTSGHAYTWLPTPGAVIQADDALYEVDGRVVPVLPGARPLWRTLRSGVRGNDVAQLNTALARLGHQRAIAGSNVFSWRTKTAVRRWQRAHHLPRTGVVEPGQLVFATPPLRIATVHAQAGAPAQPGDPLLSATAATVLVTLPVPVDQAYLLHQGAPVTVTLPDAVTTTPGTVTAMSRVATLPDQESQPSRNGNPETATVDATITLRHPALAARYASAPVSVEVTLSEARQVLAVPITALLARADGGFAVTVVDGSQRNDVQVRTGMSTDTMVQVSGPGIASGTRVLVATS